MKTSNPRKGLEALAAMLLAAVAVPAMAAEDAAAKDAGAKDAPAEEAASEEDSTAAEIEALTSPESVVDFGIGFVDNDNYHYGQYRGLTEEGTYALFNLDFTRRDDSTGTWLSVDVQNLGLDTRSLSFEQEKQGDWGYFVDYAQIPRTNFYTHHTGLQGIGDYQLAINTASPRDVRLETERDRVTLGGSKWLGDTVKFAITARDESRDGARQFGRGTGGAFEFLAEPLDQQMRQIEATLSYAGKKLNLSGGYYGTQFDNANDALTILGGAPELANGTGAFTPIALPPDNQSHQLYLAGNYQFASTVNSTFKAAYAKSTQDDSFILPAANGRTNLDGRIDTTLLQFGINARPMPRLTLLANIRYEDRNDKTPIDNYFGNTSTSTATGENEPRDIETTFGKIEASYYLPAGFRLTAGFDDERKERSTSSIRAVSFREETDEQSYRFEIRRSISETITGELSYVHSDRDGSTPLTNTVTSGALGSNLLLPIYIADRKRDKMRLMLDWSPGELLSLQFTANYADDEYDAGRTADNLGAREGRLEHYSLDAGFNISPEWQLHAWASTSENSMDQAACVGASSVGDCLETAANPTWLAQLNNAEDAAGLGLEGAIGESFKLGLDASYSDIEDEFGQVSLTAGGTAPVIPDINTRVTTASLYGRYLINEKSSVRLDMVYDKYTTDDWTWTNFTYRDGTRVFNNPDEDVFYVGISYSYRWQ